MDKRINAEKQVQKKLGESCACYVLISCTEPDQDGKMDVQMDFEGDESLAAFLVTNAAQVFEGKSRMRESK